MNSATKELFIAILGSFLFYKFYEEKKVMAGNAAALAAVLHPVNAGTTAEGGAPANLLVDLNSPEVLGVDPLTGDLLDTNGQVANDLGYSNIKVGIGGGFAT